MNKNKIRYAAFVVLNDDNYLLKLCSHFHCSRNNFHILPAFLPPTQAEYIGLSEDILFFRKQHSFLLSANAYKLRYENGIDIYGWTTPVTIENMTNIPTHNLGGSGEDSSYITFRAGGTKVYIDRDITISETDSAIARIIDED